MKELKTTIPLDLKKEFVAKPKAAALWRTLTPIAQRDYITWITSAKQDKTRERRVRVACSKLEAGKKRPCCYAVVPMTLYRALRSNSKAKAKWPSLNPMEKRDFADWVEAGSTTDERTRRTEKACARIAAGKRHP